MQQPEIHNYLRDYFQFNNCKIVHDESGSLTVQLTEELDQALMNRPFYWHYVKKTGGIPEPMTLSLVTDKNKRPPNRQSELVHFGSPRLHQIFQSTQSLGAYVRMYEKLDSSSPVRHEPLQPWLVVNVKVSYESDRKRDEIYSIGLQLINGMIVHNCQERLLGLKLTPKIPDYCFTLSPLIKPESGLKRIEALLRNQILANNHSWADEARTRWENDLTLLESFYEDVAPEDRPEAYFAEKEALQALYEPKVNVTVINGGLFYLSHHAFLKAI